MAEKFSTSLKNAAVDAAVDLVDVGTLNPEGRFRIYQGTQPASPSDAPTGSTLLVEILLANPAFGSASNGQASLAGVPRSATASATGTAQWFRIVDRDGNGLMDGAVTAVGGGGELEIDNTSINSGQTVEITSFTYTQN